MASEASAKYPPMLASYYLYVEDANATMNSAVANGATVEMEVVDMPYGDRQCGIKDTHGNIWWVSQRIAERPYTA
jgi:PhnB protein